MREWLKSLPEKKILGEDIKTNQWTYPWRKPLVDLLREGLWEVRTKLPNTIARVIFFECDGEMILLHAFKKTTQKTPSEAIKLAKSRKRNHEHE